MHVSGLARIFGISFFIIPTFLFVPRVLAQESGGGSTVIQPLEWSKLETTFMKEVKGALRDLATGDTDAKDNAKLIDLAAQYYSYRVTWPSTQATTKPRGQMDTAHVELDRLLYDFVGKNKPKSDPFLQMFGEKMVKYSREVIETNEKQIARINSARVLARLAKSGVEDTADLLTEVVKDPKQSDAVRLWALRGLRYLVALSGEKGATVFSTAKGKERQFKAVEALVLIVDRKPPGLDALTTNELNGYRYVRREAVIALAQCHESALLDEKGEVKIPVVFVLLRVARRDGLSPEPRADEMAEAALGVARILNGKPYQPDYAAYHLAGFVAEFALRSQTKVGRDVNEPWKVHASRLIEALEAFKTAHAKSDYVIKAMDLCLPVLKQLEATGIGNPGDLGIWFQNNPPKDTSLFKGLPDTTVKDPNAQPKEEPKKDGDPEKK